MRSLVLIATASAVLVAVSPAHARLFWQTYGSTVPTADRCVWNLNSDYFVPRHCDSGQYDLLSPCKRSHSVSPACKSIHPVYAGACQPYCTPYGACHYKWRDHVYKKYCGCTPLRCYHGHWKLGKCKKHCPLLRACGGKCGGGCGGALSIAAPPSEPGCNAPSATEGYGAYLPNVEPLGGETLGTIEAIPAPMLGGARAGGIATGGSALGQLPPDIGSVPPTGLPGLAVPGLFGG